MDAHLPPPSLLDRVCARLDGIDLSKCTYLTPIDTAFLYGEDAGHSLFVAGLYRYERRLDKDVALKCVRDYALSAKGRMISRIVKNDGPKAFGLHLGRPYFEIEENFDANDHFEIVNVPAPGGRKEVEEVCSRLQAIHLGFEHSPWKCWFLEGVENGETSASKPYEFFSFNYSCPDPRHVPFFPVYWMSHHALSDGQGFMRYLLQYISRLDEKGDLVDGPVDAHSLAAMQYSAGRLLTHDNEAHKGLLGHAIDTVTSTLLGLYNMVAGILIYLLTLVLFLWTLPKRSLRTDKTLKAKQFAYSDKLPLADLKAAKNALGVTINDLMVCAGTSAVERFLASHKVFAEKEKRLIYLIPTSVRKPDDFSLSNSSSGYLVPFATRLGLEDRLHAVAATMQLRKRSWEPWAYTALWPVILTFPWLMPKYAWTNPYLGPVTATITNVPGAKDPVYWAGVPMAQHAPVVCCIAAEIGIAILSLHDHVTAGVLLDLDPESSGPFRPGSAREIVELLQEEVDRLIALSKTGPRKKRTSEALIERIPHTTSWVFRKVRAVLDEIEHPENGFGFGTRDGKQKKEL